jgi:glucose/arabinose dehydrogenase
LLIVVALATVACGSASNDAASHTVAIGAGLSGSAAERASVYATGLVHVSAFAFDDDGRLWVATAAYSDEGDDAIYVVESAGATPKRAVTSLHTPLGLVWYDGELYVASNERVDAYRDFDGTAFANRRTVLALPDGVGESNNLVEHDGRLYLGISAPCDHCEPSSPLSAAIVSFRPDGRDVETFASGIRAAVGLVFDGNDLLVTMNQRDDLGDGTPGDWLAIVRDGDDWGFPDCYGQDGSSCADVPQALAELDTHAAVDGVAVLGNAAYVAEWAKGTVQRVELGETRSSDDARVTPFVTGLKSPTAVAVTPSKSLVIGDWATGRIYEITLNAS